MKTMIHSLSKRTKSALAVLLALVMVFGIVAVITPVEAQAVEIQATDAGFYSLAYDTDGSTTFGEGTQIRVINQTRAGKNKSDAVYTTNGASWAPVDASNYLVWDGTGANTFYGVYPATAGYSDFTLPTDQTGGVQVADWMTATYTGAKGNGSVKFRMQHLLSKVTVNLKFASQYDGEPTISDVSFPISGTQLYANYQNDGSTTITINSYEKPSVLPHQDSEMSYTAILPSWLYSADKPFINLTVNSEDHLTAYAGSNDVLTSTGLQPGKHYTFDLTVGKDVVTLSTVSVEGWTDGGIIDGGVAEELFVGINATAMNAEALQNAVTQALQDGETDIKVTLAADADAEMFVAIRSALVETEGVEDGSIHLTLAGCIEIPEYNNTTSEESQSGVFGQKTGYMVEECVTELGSVTLPDVVTIGEDAFFCADNLTKVSAPKATLVGNNAFDSSGLAEVDLPLVATVGASAFSGCEALTEISLPSATAVGAHAFLTCRNLSKVDLPSVTTIDAYAFQNCEKLTDITFGSLSSVNHQLYGIFYGVADTSNITFTLSADQKVMAKGDNNYWTAGEELYSESVDYQNKTFMGYTFKDVKFAD